MGSARRARQRKNTHTQKKRNSLYVFRLANFFVPSTASLSSSLPSCFQLHSSVVYVEIEYYILTFEPKRPRKTRTHTHPRSQPKWQPTNWRVNTVNYSNGYERRPDQTRILLHFITTTTKNSTKSSGMWRLAHRGPNLRRTMDEWNTLTRTENNYYVKNWNSS